MADEEKTIVDDNKDSEIKPDEKEVIIFGDDEEVSPPQDSSVIKHLRTVHKKVSKENQELKEKIDALTSSTQSELGAKPTLEKCEYDKTNYESELEKWYEKRNSLADKKAKQEAELQKKDADWQKQLATYREKQADLKVDDFDEKEEFAHSTFSEVQLGIIVSAADHAAKLIYALGCNPEKANELSLIKDPVKFTAALARLESKMKVVKRVVKKEPEKVVEGSGSVKTGGATLEKLREEAERTGDYSKVFAYKRKMNDG